MSFTCGTSARTLGSLRKSKLLNNFYTQITVSLVTTVWRAKRNKIHSCSDIHKSAYEVGICRLMSAYTALSLHMHAF